MGNRAPCPLGESSQGSLQRDSPHAGPPGRSSWSEVVGSPPTGGAWDLSDSGHTHCSTRRYSPGPFTGLLKRDPQSHGWAQRNGPAEASWADFFPSGPWALLDVCPDMEPAHRRGGLWGAVGPPQRERVCVSRNKTLLGTGSQPWDRGSFFPWDFLGRGGVPRCLRVWRGRGVPGLGVLCATVCWHSNSGAAAWRWGDKTQIWLVCVERRFQLM